jgi:predicted nuclease of predicted toxin-antitoxin system
MSESAPPSSSSAIRQIWLDNHLSPALTGWINATFGLNCVQLRDLGLERASDREIFEKAREADALLISKDRDFAELVLRLGAPPPLIWLTCGNTSNRALRSLLGVRLATALSMIESGEAIVEIGGEPQ